MKQGEGETNTPTPSNPAGFSGYLIAFTLIGLAVARRFAQVQPITELKATARRAAELETMDRMVPYVIVGAIAGLIIGIVAERWLPKWSHAYWLLVILIVSVL